jgi:ELWxxDGT repeat protein
MVAIERGLTETRGDLVWIMDDDDIACPNALATLAEPLLYDRDVVFSYGQMVKFVTNDRGDIVEGEKSDYPTRDSRPFLLKLMEDCFITGHPCVLVRRMAFEKMLPFDRSITSSVDYYFHLHMALLGSTAAVDEVVLLQRQHQGPRGPAETTASSPAGVQQCLSARHPPGRGPERAAGGAPRKRKPVTQDFEEFTGRLSEDFHFHLYFSADDGVTGWELWRSDGTVEGTQLVKDINPGPGSSHPENLAEVGGILYFAAEDGATGYG